MSASALFTGDRASGLTVTLLLGLAVVVPLLNLLLPQESMFALSSYSVSLLGKYLCYALLALALDLLWGYAGLLSLGHGAFFALGGYAMGMYLMRQIGSRGVYGDPELPDFMIFLDWQELPWYWLGFDSFPFAMAMALLIPGILALVFGWLAFRSRVGGVYFSIMTQAMTFALMLAFFRNEMGFGGNNGLTDFKDVLGFDLQSDAVRCGLFVVTALTLLGSYLACRKMLTTRFGSVIIALRDGESRVRFLGYSVASYKLVVFVISAMLAGLAGALYVPQVGIINPGEFAPLNSIEIAIWVAVGGRGTLHGAMLGAVIIAAAETLLTAQLPELWLFALGALFLLVTLFLPRGFAGLLGGRHDD
ncbi:urea ABC transporter permease subunit UrtC [Congregibacter litoralis]|uniref:Amino acid/amide ABC transporter membrane protein 2, HAAT family n=1 Tax=Congregibacter litoralis KT71 TaxID=314285 RepID=A4AAN3_9GAMM|nr:urea ABC transporter permease subunit UrtC [Congregibacter litoralis]EAQ97110.1 amino acid/amide ABC transporter membrane protein 2, HAAT family [Congregibacter litoralis KT71]